MIPPSFSDLGKAAKDLFDKKFKFGLINVECISKKDSTSLTVNASHDLKSKDLSGHFETKYSTDCGVDILNKWSMKNVFTTEVTKTYKSIKGLKNVGIATFEPDTGKKSLKSKNSYKRDYFNFNSDMVFNSCKPDINANIVFGCTSPKAYLAGVDLSIDTNAHTLKHYTLALGYEKPDFGVLASVKNICQFDTWIYQKISKHTNLGIHVNYDKEKKITKYGICGQYNIPDSDNSFIKAKVNQDTLIGLVYGCNVNDGVQLTFSAELNGQKFDTGPHNFGVGIVYEP